MTRTRQRKPSKPTREELAAAVEKLVPDVIAKDLRVLFCGINPGLYSAATGHHFARPGNRFWPTIHRAGFTDRLLSPYEDHLLLESGQGITNLVARASATADQLTDEEIQAGGKILTRKAKRYRPRIVAVLGVTSYRTAFERPDAKIGLQTETIGDGRLWVLPNPSGLNAHYQLDDLVQLFAELRVFALEEPDHGDERD
jgi:TDG/mug DNA glycosylase family protein